MANIKHTQRADSLEQDQVPDHLRFRVGDEILPDYLVVDKLGETRKGTNALPLGRGNAGLVYRALYKGQLRRVVKFLSPHPKGDGQAVLTLERLARNFHREVSLLSELTHTHIVKIVDFGDRRWPRPDLAASSEGDPYMAGPGASSVIGNPEQVVTLRDTNAVTILEHVVNPYYVMDFIPGTELHTAAKTISGEAFINILIQLADAMVYLHSAGYVHMDIKEENVFIQGAEEPIPHAVLLDAGGARRIKRDPK